MGKIYLVVRTVVTEEHEETGKEEIKQSSLCCGRIPNF
jgi:hypothetical protein